MGQREQPFPHPHIGTSGTILIQFETEQSGSQMAQFHTESSESLLAHMWIKSTVAIFAQAHFGAAGAEIAQSHDGSYVPIFTQAAIVTSGNTVDASAALEYGLPRSHSTPARERRTNNRLTQKRPGAEARAKRKKLWRVATY